MPIRSMSAAVMVAVCQLALVLPAVAAVNMPAGRIAITHDGNEHDLDDIGALPMNCALIKAAGLQSRLVHVDYSNHLGKNSASQNNSMTTSANGSVSRFGLDGSRFFNDQTQLAAAIANFKSEAEKSTAADPLWFICSGPMETAWRCINAVTASKRQYIHCISHSTWNETHADTTQLTHTWAKMKTDFTTVTFHDIVDQNNSDGDNDWSTPLSKWYWLRDASDPNLAWVYTRNQFTTKYDPSDAGMTYWLMSGGPNGGDEKAGWPEAKALLLNPVTGGNNPPVAKAGADKSVSDSDGNGSQAVALSGSGSSDSDGTISSYVWKEGATQIATGVSPTVTLAVGSHTITLTVTDNKGATDSDTVVVTVTPASGSQPFTVTLMNADNEQVITAFNPITNNATIALSSLATANLNIRANVSGVGSTKFVWTGAEAGSSTESTAPYAMKGDTGGNYKAWTPTLGTYTLTITTYSGSGATGSVLQTATYKFTVTDPAPAAIATGG